MFTLQTQQTFGEWLSHGEVYSSFAEAKAEADAQFIEYFCPKRVIDSVSHEVLYTVGDSPEYQAFMDKVRARLEPSERFNMPTAFESRLNIWRNSMETNECFTIYQCEAVAVIDDMLPPYGPQAPNPAEHELAVSDVLGMYLMGEEL